MSTKLPPKYVYFIDLLTLRQLVVRGEVMYTGEDSITGTSTDSYHMVRIPRDTLQDNYEDLKVYTRQLLASDIAIDLYNGQQLEIDLEAKIEKLKRDLSILQNSNRA